LADDVVIAQTVPVAAQAVGWPRRAAGLLLVALSATAVFLAWGSRHWPLIHDAPLMHYAAWRIGQGAVPYRDLFDMNFPGVYLLHLGVLALVGSGDEAWRFFDLFWLGGTSALIAVYCRPFGAWSSALAALLFGVYHLAGGAWSAGQRDYLLVAFLLAGAVLVARFWEDGRSLWPLAMAGLVLGGAMTLKPHAALFWLVLALAAAQGALRRRRQCWSALAMVVGFGLLAPLAVALWLWKVGGLASFLEILTRYVLSLYSRFGRVSVFESLRWHSYGIEILGIAGALAALSLWRARAQRQFDVRRGLLLMGLGYGIVHYWVQGKGWEYHLYPLVGFACCLAASWVDRVQVEHRPWIPAAILGGLLLLIIGLGVKGVEALDPAWIAEKERRVQSLVRDLEGRVQLSGSVQVLDTTEGGIHALFRLGLNQPTRFIYDFHFFHDVDTSYIKSLRAEFLDALRRQPSEFLVVFERGWPDGGYDRLTGFPELLAWIDASYVLDQERHGYRLYAQRRDR